jgi:hypothetical protein
MLLELKNQIPVVIYLNNQWHKARAFMVLDYGIEDYLYLVLNIKQNMKILTLKDNKITFEDGYILKFKHDQECCESVYADCENIQSLHNINDYIYEAEFNVPPEFEMAEGIGVHLIAKSGMKYLISCYNQQNGFYSDELEMYFYNLSNPNHLLFHLKNVEKKHEID